MDLHVWAYPRRGYIFQVSSKFVQGFRSSGAPGNRNLAFPITLAIRFYNSLYYRTSRDKPWLSTKIRNVYVHERLCSSVPRHHSLLLLSSAPPVMSPYVRRRTRPRPRLRLPPSSFPSPSDSGGGGGVVSAVASSITAHDTTRINILQYKCMSELAILGRKCVLPSGESRWVRCLTGGGSLWTKKLRGKGRPPPTNFGIRKLVLGLSYGEKIAENFNRLSRAHQRHRQTTDRQTDGSAIAYSKRNVYVHVC